MRGMLNVKWKFILVVAGVSFVSTMMAGSEIFVRGVGAALKPDVIPLSASEEGGI